MDSSSTVPFNSDTVQEYLRGLTKRLRYDVETTFAKAELCASDEDVVVAAVSVWTVLCEQLNAAPPKFFEILQWRETFLGMFDQETPVVLEAIPDEAERAAAAAQFAERREQIVQCFYRFEAVASQVK